MKCKCLIVTFLAVFMLGSTTGIARSIERKQSNTSGYQYIVLEKGKTLIYANYGPIILIKENKKQNYPIGTVLVIDGKLVKNIGVVKQEDLEKTLISSGILVVDAMYVAQKSRNLAQRTSGFIMEPNCETTIPSSELTEGSSGAAAEILAFESGITLKPTECASKKP